MLLAVDIGNTNISFAVMSGIQIVHKFTIGHGKKPQVCGDIAEALEKVMKKYSFRNAIICSVVPFFTHEVKRSIEKNMGLTAEIVGIDLLVPMTNNYRKPKEVGQDRLICAYAAKCLVGRPAIIIDLGTAITFDVVSETGSYEGGLIVPGIRLSVESLSHKTALLPEVDYIKSPKNLIGRSTQESILSGIFHGYGAMCSGLIDQLGQRYSKKPKVIVTGGHTQLMKKYFQKKITSIESSLVFKGLYLLSQIAKTK